MKKYKWGIIGTGVICTKFCSALSTLENAEIAAVCSRSSERGREFADKFGIEAVYTDADEMCAEAGIDIVYIGTPNNVHINGIMAAAENGVNILCEKPMTLNERQAREAALAAEKHGVFLMEAMWVRFLPAVQKVRSWIEGGRIGTPVKVMSSFHIDAPEDSAPRRLYSREQGGGALLDLGIYNLAAADMFLGEPTEIIYSEAQLSDSGIDCLDSMLLNCGKGQAFLTTGFDRSVNNAIIEGTDGYIVVPEWCGAHAAYLYSGNLGELTESFCQPLENGMEHEAAHVMECLDKGLTESPVYPISKTFSEMNCLDALRAEWGLTFDNEDVPYRTESGTEEKFFTSDNLIVNEPDWYRDAVVYHIYPLGMCGAPARNDFSSAPVSRLREIARMAGHIFSCGFNAVYFGPLFESTSHGYDTADYRTIDRRLGTNADFALLCSELHSRGIRVVIDGVFNHVGRDFWAFRDVQEKKWESAYRDWFNISFDGNSNYNDGFWYEGWEGHYELVKLNLFNSAVREYIFDSIRGWINEFGIDGLRLDVAYLLDQNFLCELRRVCKSARSDFFLLGECIHGDYTHIVNDAMLDSATNYECYKGIHSSINSGNMHEIGYSLHRQFGSEPWCLYRGISLYSFVDNHDVSRIASVLGDASLLPIAYALEYSMPGIPSVYYGSEFGMTGGKSDGDAALRPALNADDIKRMKNDLTRYIARLGAARRQSVALRRGDYHQLYVNSHQLIFARCFEGERVICAFNASDQPHTAHFDAGAGRAIDLITGRVIDFSGGFELAPRTAYIGKVY